MINTNVDENLLRLATAACLPSTMVLDWRTSVYDDTQSLVVFKDSSACSRAMSKVFGHRIDIGAALDFVRYAAWVMSLPNDLVVVTVGKVRRFGR